MWPLHDIWTNEAPCKSVNGKNLTSEFESVFAATQRGPYNGGHNPINTLLTLWKPGVNFSSFSYDSDMIQLDPSLEWYFESAPYVSKCNLHAECEYTDISARSWVNWASNKTTDSPLGEEAPLKDAFNLTLAPTTKAPYKFTSTLPNPTRLLDNMGMVLDSCSTTRHGNFTDDFEVFLVTIGGLELEGWNWTSPVFDLQLNNQTANLTIDGYYLASPHSPNGTVVIIPVSDEMLGRIRITFEGVIDSYHSDILDQDKSSPTWIRTVGFQNNSLNIGYNSAGQLQCASWWLAGVALLMMVLCM
jgi:hypothetical protein